LKSKAQDVVTGFVNGSGKARDRPVGLVIDTTGALLIAGVLGNTVWRVTAKAPPMATAALR
jgi:glucose/arabinose dehydrogenase